MQQVFVWPEGAISNWTVMTPRDHTDVTTANQTQTIFSRINYWLSQQGTLFSRVTLPDCCSVEATGTLLSSIRYQLDVYRFSMPIAALLEFTDTLYTTKSETVPVSNSIAVRSTF